MNHKRHIMELVTALNEKCGTNASVRVEHGIYLLQENGENHNPFSADGTQPTTSGTGLYLYLCGQTDARL